MDARASAPMSLPFLNLQFISITASTSTCSLSLSPLMSVDSYEFLGTSLILEAMLLCRYCDDIFEPKLEELINQLREGDEGWMNG
ncbi:unnamed protein product [Thlaspi arvense]|uniref:Uncharacterized protein n=1 Tax=Thlaspi arvense TaxID=13288 RepID=A0AAU9RVY6_THLAR|nr:unnamed protein product [Thlaspi arvense]